MSGGRGEPPRGNRACDAAHDQHQGAASSSSENIHQLPNGNILAAHEGEGTAHEVDPTGKVVWEYTGVENAGNAQRLKNGNTLISCGTQKRVIEVTPDKRIVWEFGAGDAPDLNITWVSSIQQLKNGNLLIGNFLRGQEGKGGYAPSKSLVRKRSSGNGTTTAS